MLVQKIRDRGNVQIRDTSIGRNQFIGPKRHIGQHRRRQLGGDVESGAQHGAVGRAISAKSVCTGVNVLFTISVQKRNINAVHRRAAHQSKRG